MSRMHYILIAGEVVTKDHDGNFILLPVSVKELIELYKLEDVPGRHIWSFKSEQDFKDRVSIGANPHTVIILRPRSQNDYKQHLSELKTKWLLEN